MHSNVAFSANEMKTRFQSINSRVNIHDRTQVETVFSYGLKDGEYGNPHYRIDAYLFLPVQSGINPGTYSRSQFYNDIRALVRLREPKLTFKEMIGAKGDDNPLVKIRQILEIQDEKTTQHATVEQLIEEARLYGCSYVSYFWRRVDRRVKRLAALGDTELEEQYAGIEKSVFDLCYKGYLMLDALRKMKADFKTQLDEKFPELQQELDLVNEYCSYCFRDGLLRVLSEIQKVGDYHRVMPNAYWQLQKFLRFNRWYASKAGFFWVNDESDAALQEEYIYRRGALKRRISSVLYLDPRSDFFFGIRQQFAPMIAAGFAAGWALFATLFLFKHSQFQGYQFFSALSLTGIMFVTAVYVISYILKDRIKEWMRRFFEKGFVGQRPDLTSNIFFRSYMNKYLKIGMIKEYFGFIKNSKIPPDILALRLVHNDRVIDLDELASSPIHYAKLIKLKTNALRHLDIPVSEVHDIIRLNIESYLLRLDDPLHRGLALSKEKRAIEVLMPKVYHMDFILKYSPLKNTQNSEGVVYDYYRLVVTKRGLSRIEQLK